MPSSNSKKKPQDRKQAQTRYGSNWKKPLSDLDLPSGEVCQVRRPGVQGLIKAKALHSLDSLTAIVQNETIPKAEGKPTTDVEAIANDPEKFGKMMDTVDKIVCHVVVQPKVVTNLTPEVDGDGEIVMDGDTPKLRELTDDEKDAAVAEWEADHPNLPLVYVDWIDSVDKMFIMNFAVGGSGDLAEFRKATQVSVGGVQPGEATADPAE